MRQQPLAVRFPPQTSALAIGTALRFVLACVLTTAVMGPRHALADIPVELLGVPVEAVTFSGEGSVGLRIEDAGITLGVALTRTLLRDITLRLLESGRFADVRIDAEAHAAGARLLITVEPRIVLTRIEILGENALSETALREAADLAVGAVIVPGAIASMSLAIKSAYSNAGYPEARVVMTLRETDAPERRVLHLEIAEGEPARVGRMDWTPDAPPPDVDVHDALGIGEGDVLDRRGLREGARALEARLRAAGYLEARVGVVSVEESERGSEGAGPTVRVPCRLGRRYRVIVDGEEPLERGDVEAVLSLADERLSVPVMRAMEARVVDVFRRHGFPEPSVRVRRTTDPGAPDDPTLAILAVEVDPGTRLRVVGVSFPGAVAFTHSFLRDQLRSYLEDDLPHPTVFEPVDSETFDRLGISGRPAIASRSVAAPREDLPNLVWHEPTYVTAVEHITALYQGAGYLSVEIGAPTLTPLDEPSRAIVVITVVEGPRTLLWDVRVEGSVEVPAGELLAEARLARGEPFSAVAVEEARLRILDRYRERGYLYARVDVSTNLSDDRSRAEITFEVNERFVVEVGDIRIEGAVRTDPAVIREHIRLHTGGLYRPSLARESEEALLALGIFSTVRVVPDQPDLAERVKPIVVTVRERTAQELALSGGIGTGDGGRVSFEYSFYDLFGVAMSFTLRAQFAYQFFLFQDRELQDSILRLELVDRLERRLSATFGFPHIPGAPDLRASVDLVHLRDNFRDFGLDKNGATLSFIWSPVRRFGLTFAAEIEQNIVSLFDNLDLRTYLAQADIRTQRLLRVPDGESAIASARLSASLDLRDSPFVPTDGVFMSATLEFARTVSAAGSTGLSCATFPNAPTPFLGTIPPLATVSTMPPRVCLDPSGSVVVSDPFLSSFLKLTINVSGYVEVVDDWVIALQLRGGRVFHLETGSRTYPNRAFYLGGVDSIRGFLQDQVIPQDQLDALDRAVAAGTTLSPAAIVRSGDFFYLLRAELRFPIVGDLQGGVFADVGNVWADADAVQGQDLIRLRWTVGLGVRYATPVGPLAVDYGFNLTRRGDDEPFGALHFSIGLF